MIPFLLFFGILVPAILFLITEQRTLKLVSPENRSMQPGEVWLQIIPLFGLFWQFIVVTRIARSVTRQLASFDDDSIIGLSTDRLESLGKNPLYYMGVAYCSLTTTAIILNISHILPLSIRLLGSLLSFSGMICWIVFWVRLIAAKRLLKNSWSSL